MKMVTLMLSDYGVMKKVEKGVNQSQKDRGISGCYLVLLAPLAGLTMLVGVWFKLQEKY
ncbi:MAG: hypothetical protein KJ950_03285 [Proteobacteria bacterium]|nr:hypothetical protein [Pseudomonadota bacterium]MBU1686343.1 hypothetical protein [Pseudomonadota bacterium]